MKGSHTTNTFRQTECQTTNHLVTYHQKEPFDMQGNASLFDIHVVKQKIRYTFKDVKTRYDYFT